MGLERSHYLVPMDGTDWYLGNLETICWRYFASAMVFVEMVCVK